MRVAVHAVTGRRGGPRTYALALLRALIGLDGDDAFVLLSDQPVNADECAGATRISVPMPGGTAMRPIAEAIGLPLAARRARADVFHGTKQTLPRGLPCPGVVTVLDLAPHLFPETFSRAAGLYLRRSTESAVRRAARVIAISAHTAADVHEHLGVPQDRIDVVPLGVDPRFREPVEPSQVAAVRERLGVPERYLLSVGTIQPRKNVDVLLDAVDRLAAAGRDVPRLVLVGRTGWMSDDVVARAAASPHVLHIGEVSAEDLPVLLAGADVFLSPSSYEGFGLAVAEAMAAGTAVIAGGGSATDEVVGDAGRLVPPRDVAALADALDALLGDDAARSRLAASGREHVAQLTWRATAERTREVYRAVRNAQR